MRVLITALILFVLTCVPLRALAATTVAFSVAPAPKLIITEVQTTGDSASQEFVELYNTTDADVDLADTANAGKQTWKLQFYSAASTSSGKPDWTKPSATVSLTGIIPAHDYFLLASTGYAPGGIDGDQSYSSRLSDTGGGLQLVASTATTMVTYDRLMWKQPVSGQALPVGVVATPPARGSVQRVPNDDSEYINIDGTLTDFASDTVISPKDMWQPPAPVEDVPEDTTDPSTPPSTDPITDPIDNTTEQPAPSEPIIDNTGLQSPYVTELLPNPAAPQTDAADEFIELYNPNDAPFDLKGFSLEVGTTTLHDFTFTSSAIIAPLSYRAFYSADTGLSLANSGGQARLLDTSSALVSQSDAYDAAADGAAWALVDGTWQWSTTPTPNAVNILSIVPPKAKVAAAAKTTTAKKATAKTASAKVKGTTSAKTKKAPTTKAKKPKAKIATVSNVASSPVRSPIHTQILVVVAALAVLYAGYEYRADISNRFYKLRQHRAIRRLLRLSA